MSAERPADPNPLWAAKSPQKGLPERHPNPAERSHSGGSTEFLSRMRLQSARADADPIRGTGGTGGSFAGIEASHHKSIA